MRWFRGCLSGSTRLVFRIYLFGVLIVIASLAGMAIGFLQHEPPSFMTLIAPEFERSMSGLLDEPASLRRGISRFVRESGIEVAVYDLSGKLLATNARLPPGPLASQDLERLKKEIDFSIGNRPFLGRAVGIHSGGRLTAYGVIVAPPPRGAPFGALLSPLILLALVALGAIFFTRSLVKPIARLSDAARAIGSGNLGARSGLTGPDAFGQLGRTFDEMADRVEGLIRSQKELMANVSHELRTPLARIRVALDIAGVADPKQARAQFTEIAEDLGELERLVNDILMTARFDLGTEATERSCPPLRKKTVSAQQIVDAAVERFRKNHGDHSLVVRLASPLPEIDADAVLLRRALDNLLDNAGNYSDVGSPVVLRAGDAGDGVVIEIQDHGAGIDRANLENVFEPFFREDPSRARSTGGVGLGLTLSRRIVEAHGGEINIESERDKGTIVRFSIPKLHTSSQSPHQ